MPRRVLILWSIGLVAAAWSPHSLYPRTGLDAGWVTGINLAAIAGLEHGTDILFSYGPLGVVTLPMAFRSYLVAANVLFQVVGLGVLALAVSSALNSRYGALWSLVGSFVVLTTLESSFLPEFIALGGFVVVMRALHGELAPRTMSLLPAGMGFAAAFLLLVKFGAGFLLAALGAVFVLEARPFRLQRVGTFSLAFLLSLTGLWIATGNELSGLLTWLRGSIELSSGYVAMSIEGPGKQWEYLVAGLAVVALAVGFIRFWDRPVAGKWPVLGIVAFVTWHIFRYGFIRHDNHSIAFFLWLPVVVAAIPWKKAGRVWMTGLALAGVLLVAAIVRVPGLHLLDPTDNLRALFDQATLVVSSEDRVRLLDVARQQAQDEYGLTDPILEALGQERVHIDSNQLSVAFAYGLSWDPAPILQTYSAYTETLDRVNADALADEQGPSRILRRTEGAIDGRYRLFESPRYMFEILCRFRELVVQGTWQVLERTANRCGSPRLVSTVTVLNLQEVAVPPPTQSGSAVFAQLDLGGSPLRTVESLLFKPMREQSILLDGRPFRLVAATAGGPLLLHVPSSDDLPFRRLETDGSNPVTLALDGLYGPATIDFYEVDIDP